MRACALVLDETDIDEQMCPSFLKDLYTNSQASPVFDIVIFATAIAGAYPDPFVGPVV